MTRRIAAFIIAIAALGGGIAAAVPAVAASPVASAPSSYYHE